MSRQARCCRVRRHAPTSVYMQVNAPILPGARSFVRLGTGGCVVVRLTSCLTRSATSALVRASGSPTTSSPNGCREEPAPQQTITDGALLDLSFALSPFERAGDFKGRQLF